MSDMYQHAALLCWSLLPPADGSLLNPQLLLLPSGASPGAVCPACPPLPPAWPPLTCVAARSS